MPRSVEECVAKLKADPDFKPRNPKQTKEEAAWAVCQAAHKKGKLSEEGVIPIVFALNYQGEEEPVIIPFEASVTHPEIIVNNDGTATVKKLAWFQLGTHKGYKYGQPWAENILDHFKKEKENQSFVPPVFVSHKRMGGTKPVRGFVVGMQQEGDIMYADLEQVPLQTLRDYPYRSVELMGDDRIVSALALLGGDEVPYFKFEPVRTFGEKEESKITLTFKQEDEGGEKMGNTFELVQEDKTFLQGLFGPLKEGFTKFFSGKKEGVDNPSDKKTFTEDEVKIEKEKVKLEAEKATRVQFAENEKKGTIKTLMDRFFSDKDEKGEKKTEGIMFAPALKTKIETLFSQSDNFAPVKFTEGDKETETTNFKLLQEVFSEILTNPKAVVPLGEESRFSMTNTDLKKEQFSDKQAGEIAKKMVEKHGSRKKVVSNK